jgi:DNA-binding beta-propeller fold protein YncE
MKRPVAAAVSNDTLYILDRKAEQLFFAGYSGSPFKTAQETGLDSPRAVALSEEGRVYVADTGNDRIVVFDRMGQRAGTIGHSGSKPGALESPASVAVGSDGRLYVADTGNDRIQVFTPGGILLYAFGRSGKEPGAFDSPLKVAVDLSDNIYVIDRSGRRLQKFDPQAKLLANVDLEERFHIRAVDVAIDPYGFAYLLDENQGIVVELDSQGQFSGRLGSRGDGPGQFLKPMGLGLAPDGMIFVVDTGNKRLDRFFLTNRQKTRFLAPNPATKMLVTGPSRSIPETAGPLAALGQDALFAYLPIDGRFSVLGSSGSASYFGSRGGGKGQTKLSHGIAASDKLGFFATDADAGKLQHFALKNGSYAWTADAVHCAGWWHCLFGSADAGRLLRPMGVAINDQGTVYVANSGDHRVDAFNPDGVFLFSIGPDNVGSERLREPTAVAWDPAGFIYIADRGLRKIIKCGPSGQFMRSFGSSGSAAGLFMEPSALAFDGRAYLYALDSRLKRVSVYSTAGHWMTDLFSPGNSPFELSRPRGLAVSGSQLVVSDAGRIASFPLHPEIAAPVLASTSAASGTAVLAWRDIRNRWALRYHVARSTIPWGPFAEIGVSSGRSFEDEAPETGITYYYRLATEALTGDLGPWSNPIAVFIPVSTNRPPIDISSVVLSDIFPANYKWYLSHPLGSAVVSNHSRVPYQNLKLSFRIRDFMDFGADTEIPKIRPHRSESIPLIATLNNSILGVTEATPVQTELTLTYFQDGSKTTLSLAKPLRVYSRNAIVWKNPARIANFVTPQDPPIVEFARRTLLDAPRAPAGKAAAFNPNIIAAMRLWDALGAMGVSFFSSPANPYEKLSMDASYPVDYTQFPRETLRRLSGQCDDLTTLMGSLLESVHIPVAILDYPGHMALLMDAGVSDTIETGLPEDKLVSFHDEQWVPIEMTLIGKAPFLEAVSKAADDYRAQNRDNQARIIDLQEAWEEFEPATLPETAWRPEAPPSKALKALAAKDIQDLWTLYYRSTKTRLLDLIKADPGYAPARVDLGHLEWEDGHAAQAREQFKAILSSSPADAAALNALGNIDFLQGRYAEARAYYLKAAASAPENADIRMNMLKADIHLKNSASAREDAQKATALDLGLKSAAETLLLKLKES